MTASSTRRSRGVSSSGVVISLNMLTTSVMRQGGGQRIEPQPAQRGASQSSFRTVVHPSCDFPWRDQVTLARLYLETSVGPQSEIHRLGGSVCLGERFPAFDRID